MINVLVVDDSGVAREYLVALINREPGMTVVGTAADGLEAIAAVERLRPTIITMDIVMPRMGGPEAIERIMQLHPTPIVVVTGNTITAEVRTTFESLESGALAIVPRPTAIGNAADDESARDLIRTLRLMAEIKVVRRMPRRPLRQLPPTRTLPDARGNPFRIVAIGASTGGPSALKTVLTELRKDFPVPIVVVQHIAAGFVDGFVSWLRDSSALHVKLAEHREILVPGRIYVAPDGAHLTVEPEDRAVLIKPPGPLSLGSLCPSVHHLFESVARTYGSRAVAVLLTGMGRDGADALLKLQRAGAITVAQDKNSSIVHGMPGEAIALGAANYIMSPPRIAEFLTQLATTALQPTP
jgi:two-component system, chemotaxis family, protein-glutamate methylesterase/glutaminase